ncbi:RDD family protein [Catellatospora tritici]|uniref:RDD family protein n=1 Tax=Catellatospora tritici TaxID=2851566 RepID=UPI001C2D6BA1|nr:RDD family protein [Catellatospora tritici]MBV1855342.1 RDD family protein [Catellatospora tritici]
MTTPVPPGPTPDQPGVVRPPLPTPPPGIPHQAPPPWGPPPGSWTPPPAPPGAWTAMLVPLAPNGAPLASFGRRLGAHLIDLALYAALYGILMVPVMIFWFASVADLASKQQPHGEMPPGEVPPGEFFALMGMMFALMMGIFAVSLLFTYLYYVEYQLRTGGRTLGKKMLKLVVAPVDPTRVLTRADLAKRWAVQFVAAGLVPLFNYVDGFWQLWDKPLQQCLHDKAAQTVVVKVG